MNFIVSASTDVGIEKNTNQDSLSVLSLTTPLGKMVFAILCDGMGGLAKGEVASASLVNAFRTWAVQELPKLCNAPLQEAVLRSHWEKIIAEQNTRIKAYGAKQGVRLGTTAVLMLLTQTDSFILNVGDSRAYEITSQMRQLTKDQTFVAREVSLGRMTPEQAEVDARRSVLLQCVGASEAVYPDIFVEPTQCGAVYMLCSDGFRHEIRPEEIAYHLQPALLVSEQTMIAKAQELIELNKQRQERDNISVILIRTF